MSKFLNCFGRVNALVNSNGVVLLDSTESGTHILDLGQGIYRIALIGGGGGGAKMQYAAGHNLFNVYAKGGVAATADFWLDITQDCTATVVIGSGGAPDSRGDTDTTATNGTPSYITGIPGLTLYCGNGTAGNVYSRNSSPGTMGTLTLQSNDILRVDMNSNEHPITSTATAGVRPNTNWPTNTIYGRGGGVSGNYLYYGGTGYCLIRYYNRNYFHWEDEV